MRFYDAYEYEIDTSLCKTEKRLKDLYFENQDRHLEKPHDIKDCRDIFVKASQTEDCLFPKFLVDNLEEDLFFHKNLDCEIYKHFRYLPCNWHSHSFLEVLCVLHGSCYNYIQEQKLEMQAGDICIIAPNTPHAISVFSDDCIVFNIILRTAPLRPLSSEPYRKMMCYQIFSCVCYIIHRHTLTFYSVHMVITNYLIMSAMLMKSLSEIVNTKTGCSIPLSMHFSLRCFAIMGQMLSFRHWLKMTRTKT